MTTTPDTSPETALVPLPNAHRGRHHTGARTAPEHTLLSIALLLLAGAGAAYFMDRFVRDESPAVLAWTLNQPPDPAVWEFPDEGASFGRDGAAFTIEESGFGPKLTLDLPAGSARWLAAVVTVTEENSGKPVPFALGWYWARAEDLDQTPEEPFASNRAMVLQPYLRHRPRLRRAEMATHPLWAGDVKQGVFTIKLPPEATGPFRVRFERVEFQE
ncbi:MAG: hypothetical protein KF886_11700 [Candidatus Hydrogenedentes bacterium]|nr:hypothetical protein [Candidatus Hydrogenedentota bacterium]